MSFDQIVDLFATHPYLGVALVFVICGMGLPLPEEIGLVAAGYLCFEGHAELPWMMLACACGIAGGDLIPFFLGRVFGPRLLRLRVVRLVVNRKHLYLFDRWFRRRGDLVIFFARFIPGLRVVAFFTAATMQMRVLRFIVLDLCGISLTVPAFTWLGWHFGSTIDLVIARIKKAERGILVAIGVALVVLAIWYLLRRRTKSKALVEGPAETFVGPSPEAQEPDASDAPKD